MLTDLAPVLKCRDTARAVAFYCDVLGAATNREWSGSPEGWNPGYASLALLGREVHPASFAGDGAFGAAAYLRVDDVDALADHVRRLAPDAIEDGPADHE